MIAQTKQTSGTNGATRTPAAPNIAPLPAPVHIPSHTPSAQTPAPAAPAAAPETPSAAKPAPQIEMHEAPYSFNVRVIGPEGFEEQYTVRAISAEGFYARVAQLKSNLLDLGYAPAPTRGASTSATATPAAPAPEAEQAPLCAIHKTPLAKRQNARGTFYSCPQRLDDGTFCPYRPKQ